MFKGLHQILHKTTPSESNKHPHANPIMTAKELLEPAKRQAHLQHIKALLNLPPKLYDALYLNVIERFAEFVQDLPETHHGIFAHHGGLLEHGIERAHRALSLCLNHFFPEEKNFQSVTSIQALWVYAVFTAALLLDVGKIAVKHHITLCKRDGTTIKDWLPYAGPLTAHETKYYKYTFVKENRDNLRRLITGLLARQLLSESDKSGGDSTSSGGFNWIASNPDVLEAWLSMLSGEARPISPFMTVIPLADAQVIDHYIAQHSKEGFHITDAANLPNMDLGKEFLQWLQKGILDGTISVNQADSFIHTTPTDAVIITDAAAKKFAGVAASTHVNPEGVEREFKQLMELYQGSVGDAAQRYSATGGLAQRLATEKILPIINPSLLFQMGQLPAGFSKFIIKQVAAAPAIASPVTVQQSQPTIRPTPKT